MMEDEGYKSQGKKASGLYHFTNLSSSILYLSLFIVHPPSRERWALGAPRSEEHRFGQGFGGSHERDALGDRR